MEGRGPAAEPLVPLSATLKKLAPDSWFPATRPVRPPPTRMISVIIPAHNEQRYLARTLESLRSQDYGWFEVIVVANGCTDLTVEVARGLCQRLIVLSQKSLGMARNLGARMAKGEILVFLDADTTLEPSALRRIAEQFTDGFSAGTTRGRPDCADARFHFIYFLKNFLHRWGLHPGSSGVIICWKKHFERCGGFDEKLQVRENSELMRRVLRHGRYKFVDATATTSMRRFQRQGFGRLAWLWAKVWCQSVFGDLHRRHYEPIR